MPKPARVIRPAWLDDASRDFRTPDDLSTAQYTSMLRRAIREVATQIYSERGSQNDMYRKLYNAYIGGLPIPKKETN